MGADISNPSQQVGRGFYGVLSSAAKASPPDRDAFLDSLQRLLRVHSANPLLIEPHTLRLLEETRRIAHRFIHPDGFLEALGDGSLPPRLSEAARTLKRWAKELEVHVKRGGVQEGEAEAIGRFIGQAGDLAWQIKHSILENLVLTQELLGEDSGEISPAVWIHGWTLNMVSKGLGRLGVGGRYSVGLAVYAHFRDSQALERFLEREVAGVPLVGEISRHSSAILFSDHSVLRPEASRRTLLFSYKVADELGELEDNVRNLRGIIARDSLFQKSLRQPGLEIQVLAQARQAPADAVATPGRHPAGAASGQGDSSASGSQGSIVSVTNGGIENRRELYRKFLLDLGSRVVEEATSDAELISIIVGHHYRQTRDFEQAFRAAFQELEGSLAVGVMAADRPGEILIGQKGSGQELYLGLAANCVELTSEKSGLVGLTRNYLRAEGDQVPGGEVFRISRGEHGVEAAVLNEDGARPVPGDRILETEKAAPDPDLGEVPSFQFKEASGPVETEKGSFRGRFDAGKKESFPLVKYEFLAQPVRFKLNHRRANRLRRILWKNLGTPWAAEIIQEIRDRIYFKVEKNGETATGSALALSGVTGGEGVTAVSLLLALSLGKLKRNKVLYIDGRFDGEAFTVFQQLFSLTKHPIDWGNGFGFLQCFTAKDQNLCFLGAGRNELETVEFFSNGEIPALLSEFKVYFDFIIFDMPPLLKSSETRLFFSKADHFFLVCVPGKTRFADIERCKTLVSQVDGRISSVLINRQKIPLWARWIGQETFT